MRKTPLATRFTKKLIRVNDQICFAALQQWDSAKRLETLAKDRPQAFSTDVLQDNPYASRSIVVLRSCQSYLGMLRR